MNRLSSLDADNSDTSDASSKTRAYSNQRTSTITGLYQHLFDLCFDRAFIE
jgi:hypothetical protein